MAVSCKAFCINFKDTINYDYKNIYFFIDFKDIIKYNNSMQRNIAAYDSISAKAPGDENTK